MVFAAHLIQDEADSSGFLYLSKHEDSIMLMTSGAEGCTGSSDARNKGLQSETKMMNRF